MGRRFLFEALGTLAVASILVIMGCTSATDQGTTAGSGLMVVGYVQTSPGNPGLTLPVYWKNGVLTMLSTGSQTNGQASGVCANAGDVYFFGYTENGAAFTSQTPVYWKNGIITTLPLPPGSFGCAFQGGFDSSGNLCVRGRVTSVSGGDTPGYWKNGIWTPLSMTLSNGTAPSGFSNSLLYIDTSGNVYFAGWLTDPVTSVRVPVYWKNGIVNEVSLASMPSATHGGAVEAVISPPYTSSLTILLDIYDSTYHTIPACMVGSTITIVPTGTSSSGNTWWASLSPSGDLYASGVIGTWDSNTSMRPASWKNWSLITLPTPSGKPYGWTGGPQFAGDHVYFDGTTQDSGGFQLAVYWLDGELNVLPIGSYVGAGEYGFLFD